MTCGGTTCPSWRRAGTRAARGLGLGACEPPPAPGIAPAHGTYPAAMHNKAGTTCFPCRRLVEDREVRLHGGLRTDQCANCGARPRQAPTCCAAQAGELGARTGPLRCWPAHGERGSLPLKRALRASAPEHLCTMPPPPAATLRTTATASARPRIGALTESSASGEQRSSGRPASSASRSSSGASRRQGRRGEGLWRPTQIQRLAVTHGMHAAFTLMHMKEAHRRNSERAAGRAGRWRQRAQQEDCTGLRMARDAGSELALFIRGPGSQRSSRDTPVRFERWRAARRDPHPGGAHPDSEFLSRDHLHSAAGLSVWGASSGQSGQSWCSWHSLPPRRQG